MRAKPTQIRPIEESKKINLLLHALPGVGKTRLIGTGGKGTLIIRPPTEHTDSIKTPGVDMWEVQDWPDMWEVQTYCQTEASEEYGWVWLDNISLFQDHGLDDIWDEVLARKPDRKKHGLDKGEYGVNMHRLGQWVRHMVAFPGFNFGLSAHSFRWEDDPAGERLWPYVQGKNMAPKICGYMNVVAYMEITQNKRVLRLGETEKYFAKDQFDAFKSGRLVEPTMPKIVKAIEATRNKQTLTTRRRTRKKGSN